ncbi:MAG: hypothetical protein RSC91_10100 [Clostridia bacterium]
MTQTTTAHPRGGWQPDEIDLLFSAVRDATEGGRALRDVFTDVGDQLARKPNSIRNFYYARVREAPQLAPRQTPFRSFSPEELDMLLREVLMGRGRGESVRACVTRLSHGDRAGMLRYQNKYRSVLKHRPELLLSIAESLRADGLPCPDAVTACRKYGQPQPSKSPNYLALLEEHANRPGVPHLLEALCELLDSAPATPFDADMVPYQKWADARKEADRLRVQVDLLKMELEDMQG